MPKYWINLLRALTRRYALQTPRASILRKLPDVPMGYGDIVGRHGLRYCSYSDGPDHVSKSVFWFGDFDPWVVEVLCALVRPGEMSCDIGANIGDTCLAMAKVVGPEGRVFCFEPIPAIAESLRRNLAANKITWSEVVPIALSDEAGVLDMSIPEGQPGMSHVVGPASRRDHANQITVPQQTFDSWAEGADVTHVATCKIDVEGHEDKVLAGMHVSLSKGRIESIVFERHGSGGSLDTVIATLVKYGFSVFRIHKGFVSARLFSIGSTAGRFATSDYVALRDGGPCAARVAKFLTQRA